MTLNAIEKSKYSKDELDDTLVTIYECYSTSVLFEHHLHFLTLHFLCFEIGIFYNTVSQFQLIEALNDNHV